LGSVAASLSITPGSRAIRLTWPEGVSLNYATKSISCTAFFNRRSVTGNRVYHLTLSFGYQLAMPTLSEESRQIVASLAHRVGPNADIATITHAVVSILQDMDAALAPIIGQQGAAALLRRSLHLCVTTHPSLAASYGSLQAAPILTAIAAVLVEQSKTNALFFGKVLLTTLIGPSLTARLLCSVWEPSLSDTPSQEKSP